MPSKPEWLSEMLNVRQPWDILLTTFYHIFYNDFVLQTPFFDGKLISWDERILDGIYPEGFWHLITRDDINHGRIPDYRRSERLPRCAPTILHNQDQATTVWDYRESNGVIRTYLWLEDWDYVIVLQRPSSETLHRVRLITAFHVDGESRRRDLRRKRNQCLL